MPRRHITKKRGADEATIPSTLNNIHPETEKVVTRAREMRKPLRRELSSAAAHIQASLELSGQLANLAASNPEIAAMLRETKASKSKAFNCKLFSQAAAFVFDPQTAAEIKFVSRLGDIAAKHFGQGYSPLATAKRTVNATSFGCYVEENTAANFPLLQLLNSQRSEIDDAKRTSRLFNVTGKGDNIDRLTSYLIRAKPTRRKLKVIVSADGIEIRKIYPSGTKK